MNSNSSRRRLHLARAIARVLVASSLMALAPDRRAQDVDLGNLGNRVFASTVSMPETTLEKVSLAPAMSTAMAWPT
jgi:hypothetical protein